MTKRVKRSAKQRLETRYRISSEDRGVKEILSVMEAGEKLSDSQTAYALTHFRMVKRALAVGRIPIVIERIVGSFFYKRGHPYPMPNRVREALALPPDVSPPSTVARGSRKASLRNSVSKKSFPEGSHAPTQADIDAFYTSWDWARLRYRALQKAGRTCMCCGATPADGARIHVDHIKPIRHFWNLRLDPENLQILCEPCNMGKGSWDQTDFRADPKPAQSWPPGDEEPPPWVN